ncbi:Nn.00g073560.m01.CDS01 [Neocucurbitaria sp. VM-36]
MAPTCSRAGFRLLTTVLVASSIANAAALPHQVLDPRTPLAQDDATPDVAVTAAPEGENSDDPENVFEEFGELLNNHSGYQFLRDLIERLFGIRTTEEEGDEEEATVTTTVYVTPTPISESMFPPPGPSTSTTEEVSSEATPEPSPSDLMSILPVGSLTTAINITLPEPVFSTAPAREPETVTLALPPFPANSTFVGPTATAVSITDEFSATILPGTGLQSSSGNVSTPTSTFQLTSVLIVTATVVPSPVDVSAGTGINTPFSEAATPLWPNITLVGPTAVSGTGVVSAETGISNATATEAPLYPNTTVVVPVLISATGGPAKALNVSFPVVLPPYANSTVAAPTAISGTGSPLSAANASATFSDISNRTYVSPTGMVGTGTGALSAAGTISPVTFSESPRYPNTSYVIPVVIIGSGTTAVSTATISNVPIIGTAAALFPNVTTTTSTTTTTISPSEVPTLAPTVNVTEGSNDPTVEFPGLLALRSLCQDPHIRVITLPLLDRFYGANAYPSLASFPGCVAPNDRQAVQAPGLLNCSALGTEVQRCQAAGRKVVLSVKADGLDAAGGNANFGDPSTGPEPFGPYFAGADDDNVYDGEEKQEKHKRQAEVNVTNALAPYPLLNSSEAPAPAGSASAVSLPIEPSSTAVATPEPVVEPVVEPYPTPLDPTEPITPFPNLFDVSHPPSAFALTLFSLFGDGQTERADLRPLGPDVSAYAAQRSAVLMLARPLGEEVVVDGFDIQVPSQWKGTYQDTSFKALVSSLRQLTRDAWAASGAVEGGPGDLGAYGRGVVYFGWVGGLLKTREAKVLRKGWVEWDGQTWG